MAQAGLLEASDNLGKGGAEWKEHLKRGSVVPGAGAEPSASASKGRRASVKPGAAVPTGGDGGLEEAKLQSMLVSRRVPLSPEAFGKVMMTSHIDLARSSRVMLP